MIINVGINSPEEIIPLVDAGARSLFFGFLNKADINLRPHNKNFNFDGYTEIQRAINLTQMSNVEIWALFNTPYLPEIKLQTALICMEELYTIGVRRFVVSNIGFVRKAKEKFPNIEILLSIAGQCNNISAVQFIKLFDINTIVIDRNLTIKEIEIFLNENINIELIGFFDKCLFYDSTCRLPEYISPKYNPYKSYFNGCACDNFQDELIKLKVRKREEYACSFCIVQKLKQMGVSRLKVASRGKPLELKVEVVKSIKKFMDSEHDNIEAEIYKQEFNRIFSRKCYSQNCYYSD